MDCLTPFALWQYLFHASELSSRCLFLLLLRPRVAHSPAHYALAFILTCLLEAPFYAIAFRKTGWGFPKIAFRIFLINLATHPIVYFAFPLLGNWLGATNFETIMTAEIFAPVVEAVLLRRWSRRHWASCIGYALAANLVSWWTGAIILSGIAIAN